MYKYYKVSIMGVSIWEYGIERKNLTVEERLEQDLEG